MRFLLCIAGLLVSSCSEPQQAPGAPAQTISLGAGKWLIEASMDSIDGGGMPPDVVEALKQQSLFNDEICLEASEVQQPPPRFFSGSREGCDYDRLSLKDGTVSAAMRCDAKEYSHVVELDGKYGPVAYEIRENHLLEDPASGQRMSFVLTGRGRRTGEC